jgi:tRNA modification GTPase
LKNKKIISVANKTDLKRKVKEEEIKKHFLKEGISLVYTSFLKGEGLEKLENSILGLFFQGELGEKEPFLLTNLRHQRALEKVEEGLKEAFFASQKGESEEFVAFHLRSALNYLKEITGETFTEEILDRIFSQFCLGK